MAKLIGLAGVQGSGKTTLLDGLKEKGFVVDDFKVSRHVQELLGWETLDQAVATPNNMVMFQQTVLDVKKRREEENIRRTDVDIILTERTFADIQAYARLWSWELAYLQKWALKDAFKFVVDFSKQAVEAQSVYSGTMFLPLMEHIVWEDDPRRAKRSDSNFIGVELNLFLGKSTKPHLEITATSVEERVAQVETWIKKEFK